MLNKTLDCDKDCLCCEWYEYGDYYNPPECWREEYTLEEEEEHEYYDNVIAPQIEKLNRR